MILPMSKIWLIFYLGVSMAFVPRMSAAGIWQNPMWYANNVFYQSGYGLPNCTCYAWGRYWEITGQRPDNLPTGNAGDWYDAATSYQRGQVPALGAIGCLYDPLGYYAGHVYVVEQINGDGSIVTSNSGYERPLSSYPPDMSNYFWTETVTPANDYASNFLRYSRGYRLKGFIYANVAPGPAVPTQWVSGNRYLDQDEQHNNALIVYSYFYYKGWSFNAICGVLGNMVRESTINPGIWENLGHDPDLGYGLVGWTPSYNITNWLTAHGYAIDDGYGQLEWLDTQPGINGDWIPQGAYSNIWYDDFKHTTTLTPAQAAECFCINFERPGVVAMDERIYWANYYAQYLAGMPTLNPPYIPPYTDGRQKPGLRTWQMIKYRLRRY